MPSFYGHPTAATTAPDEGAGATVSKSTPHTESQLVLHLAAEGGSLKLWRYSQRAQAFYIWEKNSALLHQLLQDEDALLDAAEPIEQSLPVTSFSAAIHKLRQFPYWRHMHLVELHSDHAKQLLLLWHDGAISGDTALPDDSVVSDDSAVSGLTDSGC